MKTFPFDLKYNFLRFIYKYIIISDDRLEVQNLHFQSMLVVVLC